MKIMSYINIICKARIPEPPVQSALLNAGIGGSVIISYVPSVGIVGSSFSLCCEEQLTDKVIQVLHSIGVEQVWIRKEPTYTHGELDAAPLLEVSLDISPAANLMDHPPIYLDGPDICPLCWSGGRLARPVTVELEKKALRGSVNQLHDSRLLVDQFVRDALMQAGADSDDFVEATCVRASSKQDSGVRYIVQPVAVLPRMHASTRGRIRSSDPSEQPCPQCGRDGYFATPAEPYIPVVEGTAKVAVMLAEAGSRALLARTWECMGIGKRPDLLFSKPPVAGVVVNQMARQTLMSSSTAKYRWNPILLI